MNEKRYELWKCNDRKNGVKDIAENAYYLDDEVVDLVNTQDRKIHDLLNRLLESEFEKLGLIRKMKKYLDTIMMDKLIIMSMEFEGMEYEVETDKSICFYSVPQYEDDLKYSAVYDFHAQLKGIDSLIIDISEAEESDDGRDMMYVQIEV